MRLRIVEYAHYLDRYLCQEENGNLHAIDFGDRLSNDDFDCGSELVGREFECDALVPVIKRPISKVTLLPKE